MPAPKGSKNALGNNGGRPTKFKPEYTDRLIQFFDIEPYTKEIAEYQKEYFSDGKLKKESEKYRYIANKLPTLYRFARSIGVDYVTVWRWAEKGEEFDDGEILENEKTLEFVKFCNSYKEAKEIQKEFLIALGLSGTTPPASYAFTAKNITDMRDTQDITSGGEKIAPILVKFLNEDTKDN